jgi:hypothetical protein
LFSLVKKEAKISGFISPFPITKTGSRGNSSIKITGNDTEGKTGSTTKGVSPFLFFAAFPETQKILFGEYVSVFIKGFAARLPHIQTRKMKKNVRITNVSAGT